MAQSSFSRTLTDVKSADGSLSRTLSEGSYNTSGTSFTNCTYLTKIRGSQKTPPRTPMRPVTPTDGRIVPKVIDEITPLKSKKITVTSNKMLDCEGDRYIPNRVSTDIGRAQHLLNTKENSIHNNDFDYDRAVGKSLNNADNLDCRILKFKGGIRGAGAPQVLNTTETSPKKASCQRHIPRAPEKVLDAPELMDDFYLNILDWSPSNMIAIALSQEIFLWNAATGDITCLMSTGIENEYVTSLKWCPDVPSVLGVGLSAGRVQLWNVDNQSLIRTMHMGDQAAGRIPSLAWRDHILSSGSRSGQVRQHDTRIAAHEVGLSEFHAQEVCGLSWSPDKRYLASGANDNCVAIWPSSVIGEQSSAKPHVTLRDHQSAVKAISWCPWKPSLLSTGGGMADHTLKFWNASLGNCVKSVDVKTQVSGIIWNSEYREIITSHGGPNNQLVIWQYPDIRKVIELAEHQGRILCMASSPNNEMVASCAADETLRIWHCFQVDPNKKKTQEKPRLPAYARPIR